MLEAAKLETAKIEAAKIETSILETSKVETTKTEVTKPDVVKTETTLIEPTKSETITTEVSISDTNKTEIVDSEVKLESEPQETQSENVEINDPISSEKTELLTEIITNDKNQDVENNVEKMVTSPSVKSNEPMDVDNEETAKPDISDDDCNNVKEEVSDIQTEQSNEKPSETVNQENENENPEIICTEESKETDTLEIAQVEMQTNEVEKSAACDDVESKSKIETESTSSEIKDTSNELSPCTTSKPVTKVIEQAVVKPKEISSVDSVDKLKAMFPELEVLHKDVSTPTIDKLPIHKPLQQIDQTIAHLLATSYQNPIKWPKVKL